MSEISSQNNQKEFDLIVIGAGINGAGIARDAAMRGLKVLLLDKGDIGGGTSSWSTRLIHGGLRYLEHAEFRLVRESLRERETLLKIAPHLVKPLPILVPVYQGARRGPFTVRAGMTFYDALSFGKTLPSHRMLSADEAVKEVPGLQRQELRGAALYHDAQVEFAERLVLENVLSAVEHGARLETYARVEKLNVEDSGAIRVELAKQLRSTQLRGSSPTVREGAGSTLDRHSATASVVINAAGPWVDEVLDETNREVNRLIGGTKGSHIIVAPFDGASTTAVYVEAKSDQRPFFIIPWDNKYLIGTTDIRYDGDLDNLQITDEEIHYLLRETNRIIPTANLNRDKILYSYSGVRPLPFTDDEDERSITRRHFIRRHSGFGNLLSIVGGKLTTYRSLSEEAVDLVFKILGRNSPPCITAGTPLPGASSETSNASNPRASQPVTDRLKRIYGTRASEVIKLIEKDESLSSAFDSETGAIAAEVVYAFTNEFASTLPDCLLRRTMVGLNSNCGLNAIERAGQIAQQHLDWSESRVTEELSDYQRYVERFILR